MVYNNVQAKRPGLTSTAMRKRPFHDKADALAKQAVGTRPLQLRPCVLRRPGEPLAPSGPPKGYAAGVDGHQPVSASQHSGGDITKTEGAFGPLIVTKRQAKEEYTATATAITNVGATTRSANAPTGDGRERDR